MTSKPLCFVLMPFGTKPDLGRRQGIPFNEIYERAIAPAVKQAGMEPLRGDAEVEGGIIQRIMFERLVLCDFAVADLTTGNANVYYELGVRHAIRPHTTIPICALHHMPLPFDVAHVRSEPYDLGRKNQLTEEAIDTLRDRLVKRLEAARKSDHKGFLTDSPVYQLLDGIVQPDIERLRSEAFHERVHYSSQLRQRLGDTLRAVGAALEAEDPQALQPLHTLTQEVMPDVDELEAAFLADLFMAHRDMGDFRGVVEFFPRLPKAIAGTRLIQEQYGLALNRVGQPDRALEVLRGVAEESGRPSSETQGLIGRIHKDRWERAEGDGSPAASQYLADAIAAYRKGFESDWRDAYPGINLLTLLVAEGSDESMVERDRLLPVVRYAVDRRLAEEEEPDYWDYATLVELAVHAGNGEEAGKFLGSALARRPKPWMKESTHKNLEALTTRLEQRGMDLDWAAEILRQLEA